MKRIIALCTTLILLMGLCACTAAQIEDPGEEPIQTPTWQEQYDLGVRYLSEGNYQEAIIAFEAAITIEPGNLDSYMRAAEAYLSSSDEVAAANVLVRGYIATGDEELLWKLISEVNPPDMLGDGYWSYRVKGVPAVCYECGKDPDSQALYNKYGPVFISGCLTSFEEPLSIEICGEHLTIEQANTGFLNGVLDKFDRSDSGQQIILSGYISFNTELYSTAQIFGADIIEENGGKRLLAWNNENGEKEFEYCPGGLWSLTIDNIESLP